MPAANAGWGPAFPFGFGLSYTVFSTSLISAATNATHVLVAVDVTNTGAAASKEVVGVYYEMPTSKIVRYHKRLLTFAKTDVLAPGGSVTINMAAPILTGLGSWEPATGSLAVEPGTYVITVGPDSARVSGTKEITIG